MALSTCPKCGNHSFEMVENSPSNSRFKVLFIQCSACGCVVGTKEYYDIATLIKRLAQKLKVDI